MTQDFLFKKPLTLDEQIEHLKNNKKLVFNDISEEEAKVILYENNYINVITPFKYRFAKKGKKGIVKKDRNGCHIYEQEIEFKEYYDLYCNEREKYPNIYKNIINFERLLNSITSYEILTHYNLCNLEYFNIFLNKLTENINTSTYKENVKQYMLTTVDDLKKKIVEYKNPYVVLDNLSLNEILNILINSDIHIKNKCIQEVISRQNIIKANDEKTFYEQVSKIIRIRNCVCHNDSLEILLRYLSRKHKTLRSSSDKYSYATLISRLEENI